MKITFADKKLAWIETEDSYKSGLSVSAIKSARRKLQMIRAAPDERTIRNWKSLHFEKLSGNRDGEHSIRLNEKWRMIVYLSKDCEPHEIEVLAVEDYH